MLEGEVDVVADGDRHTLRPGDVFWTGTGCVHAFYETQGAGAVARDLGARAAAAPLVPARAGLGLPRRASRLRRRRRCGVSRVSDQPVAGILDDLDLYTGIYRQMLLIRGFEDLVQSLFLAGEVYGTTHLYSGPGGRSRPVSRASSRSATASRRRTAGTATRSRSASIRRRCSTRCSAASPASTAVARAR